TAGGRLSQSELAKVRFVADAPVHTTLEDGVQAMEVTIRPDAFENGARVRIVATIRADRPREIRFKIHQEEGSAAIQQCLLTATMGNMTRVREVHVKSGKVTSHQLFGG